MGIKIKKINITIKISAIKKHVSNVLKFFKFLKNKTQSFFYREVKFKSIFKKILSIRNKKSKVNILIFKKIFSFKTIITVNIFLFICFLLTLSLFLYTKTYAGKIYPGVWLGDINLGGKDINETQTLISERLEGYNEKNIVLSHFDLDIQPEDKQPSETQIADSYLGFDVQSSDIQSFAEQGQVKSQKSIEWSPKLEELGFSIHIDDIFNDAYIIGREGSFLTDSKNQIKALILGQEMKIDYDLQENILDEYLNSIAEEINKPPKNSTLVIKDGTVENVPGEDGYTLPIDKFKKEIRNVLENFQTNEIVLTLDSAPFKIKEEDTSDAKDKALLMMSSPLVLKYDNKVFTANIDQIASWIKFEEIELKDEYLKINPYNLDSKWILDVQLDELKLGEFVGNLASEINVSQQPKKIMYSGEKEVVLSNGRDGKKLNIEQVISDIRKRIENSDSAEREVSLLVEVEKAKTVTVYPSSYGIVPKSDERYIDISLSRQILTCFEGGKAQFSSFISSGIPKYATPRGTFNIYYKTKSTRMRWEYGPDHPDNYDLDNVPYAMFFSGDFSLHGTYWHSNFGTPMSHGCVNLPTSAAGWVYGWSPRGTKVVVY